MRSLALCALLLWMVPALAGQSPDAPRQPYRFFSVVSTANLQDKLNQAGAAGYRLHGVQRTEGGTLAAIMADAAPQKFEYEVLAGMWFGMGLRKAPRLQDLLNTAAEQGFHAATSGVLLHTGESGDGLVVMERRPETKTGYGYRVISPLAAAHVKKDIVEGVAAGYRPLIAGVHGGRWVVLMEKNPAAPLAPNEAYELRQYTAEKLRQQLSKHPGEAANMLQVLPKEPVLQWDLLVLSGTPPYKQARLVTNRTEITDQESEKKQLEDVEAQLNAAAAEGYELAVAPTMSHEVEGAFHFHRFRNVYMLLERAKRPGVRYRVLRGATLPQLAAQVNEAAQQGYRVLTGGMSGAGLIFMEKPAALATSEVGR